jgi:pilus assembly protein CpaE
MEENMPRILVVDDEAMFRSLIAHDLEPMGYQVETVANGMEGLKAARERQPDLIITDVMMPEMSGYELTQRLRREPRFAQTPILVLTSQAELQDKLKSFEAGADDHMTKPFELPELQARLGVLLRRVEALRSVQAAAKTRIEAAHIIAVHSLRGGTGCSSMAVNLAVGLAGLWERTTVLLDLVLTAGQVALMLNQPLKRTWADLARVVPADLELEIVSSLVGEHESGLQFIAAPTYPTEAEKLSGELLKASIKVLSQNYEYIVADLPHDFSDISLQTLDAADVILLLLAPEMSSIRAAAAALQTYRELGYGSDKIKLVLNSTFPRLGLNREKIEAALNLPITIGIPYTPDRFVEAINQGKPVLFSHPDERISALIEDFAFHLSKERHKKTRPASPGSAWKRVAQRFNQRRKG